VERRHPPPLAVGIISDADRAKTAARAAAEGAGEGHLVVQEVAASCGSLLLRARSNGAALCSCVDERTREF